MAQVVPKMAIELASEPNPSASTQQAPTTPNKHTPHQASTAGRGRAGVKARGVGGPEPLAASTNRSWRLRSRLKKSTTCIPGQVQNSLALGKTTTLLEPDHAELDRRYSSHGTN